MEYGISVAVWLRADQRRHIHCRRAPASMAFQRLDYDLQDVIQVE